MRHKLMIAGLTALVVTSSAALVARHCAKAGDAPVRATEHVAEDEVLSPIGEATVEWCRRLRQHGLMDLQSKAQNAVWEFRYDDALRHYDAALRAAGDDTHAKAFLQGFKVTACMIAGDRDLAVAVASEALPIARPSVSDRPGDESPPVLLALGVPPYVLAVWKEDASEEELMHAVETAEFVAKGAAHWAALETTWGEESGLVEAAQGTANGTRQVESGAKITAAYARVRLGEVERAEHELRALCVDSPDAETFVLAQYCLGGTLLERGKADNARAAFDKALARLDEARKPDLRDASRHTVRKRPTPWLDWIRDDIQRLMAPR